MIGGWKAETIWFEQLEHLQNKLLIRRVRNSSIPELVKVEDGSLYEV